MSIIYDALKKVQTGLKMENKKVPPVKPVFLYLGIAVAGVLLAQFLFNLLAPSAPASAKLKVKVTALKAKPTVKQQAPVEKIATQPQPQPQAAQQTAPVAQAELPSLVLNGIFSTGNEGYCLINNQILKVGDEIEGLIVEKIRDQEVELSNKGTIIKLSLSPAQ
ncbi:MAG: type II secretion system protein N [Candidatus Omnitrophica bacterium]|nr:type II secretion system protein N [Candidatus Omnitrophota bacterium]